MSAGYLPFTPHELEIICNKTVFRAVWEYGVELNGRQKYNSTALGDLRRRIGVHENGKSKADIKIKSIKFDIGYVWVWDIFEKIWIKIPNTKPEYANGLTLYQHQIIKKFAKKMYKESDDYEVLIEAKERMRQEVAGLATSRNMADRSKAAKTNGKTSRQSAKKNSSKVKNFNQEEIKSQYVFGDIFDSSNSAQSEMASSRQDDEETSSTCDDAYESVPNRQYAGERK